jgi:hypothetical protein
LVRWNARTVPLLSRRRRGPQQQRARPQFGLAPAAHPLSDQRALVLSHRPADLQPQLIVGILAHRPVQNLDLAAVPAQLLDEEHLVDIAAGQPVGRGDHHQVNLGQRRVIPQAVQAGRPRLAPLSPSSRYTCRSSSVQPRSVTAATSRSSCCSRSAPGLGGSSRPARPPRHPSGTSCALGPTGRVSSSCAAVQRTSSW